LAVSVSKRDTIASVSRPSGRRSSGTVMLSGGTLIASGGTADVAAAAKGGNGTVDIQQASGENVTFQLGGPAASNSTLPAPTRARCRGSAAAATPAIHRSHQYCLNGNVHRSYSGNTTSGVLTVTSGGTVVAKIATVGSYATASFKLGADSGGHVQITDPSSSASNMAGSGTVTSSVSNGASFLDNASTFSGMVAGFGPHDHTGLPGIGFGAHTMLGHSEDGGDAGGTLLHTAGTHDAKLALLGHYMATSFVTAADWHGGTLVADGQQTQQPLLSHPHA
jgi:hypothetical protein